MKETPASKITNWPDYNRSLIKRGDINLWIDEEMLHQVRNGVAILPPQGKGAPWKHSDLLMLIMAGAHEVYQLPLRQTVGLVQSLFSHLQIDVVLPCYTTLCRRLKGLGVDLDIPRRVSLIHIAIDSTGLKVFGDGEWKVRQHGTSKRRTWRKVHVALDPKKMSVHKVLLTTPEITDADEALIILPGVEEPIEKVLADGAYDTRDVRALVYDLGAEAVIPPRQDAVCHTNEPEMRDRNAALEEINKALDKAEGRKAWKSSRGYHQRSKIETQMYRMKRVFGGALKARGLQSQATEIAIRCRILNRATCLGLPRRSHAA